jgi:DNA-binding NtrC family response regulator
MARDLITGRGRLGPLCIHGRSSFMFIRVLVVDPDEYRFERLSELIREQGLDTENLHSLSQLMESIPGKSQPIVILDLDQLPLDDRFIRELVRCNPGVRILGLSTRPFHPELRESLKKHIYACLGQPPEREELIYCLKGILENGSSEPQSIPDHGKRKQTEAV